MASPKNPILLFDGACNLCNGTVRFLIKRDKRGRFRFASLQSPLGQAITESLRLPENLASIILLEGKRPAFKSTAALRALKDLGWPWNLGAVFLLVPRPIRDRAYDLIAKNRYRLFGRTETCMVPTPELKTRFLE